MTVTEQATNNTFFVTKFQAQKIFCPLKSYVCAMQKLSCYIIFVLSSLNFVNNYSTWLSGTWQKCSSPGLKDEHTIWVPGLDFSMNLIGFELEGRYKVNKEVSKLSFHIAHINNC